MVVLGIETSASVGGVALVEGGSVLAERDFTAGLVHGVELLPAIDGIVAEAGLDRASLDVIAVSRGPGSYTGIRVGVTAAKTLAWALGKRLAGVCSLDVVATNAPDAFGRVHVVLDARRERVYTRSYRRNGAVLEPTGPPEVLPAAEVAGRIEPGDAIMGDALGRYAEAFAATPAQRLDETTWLPEAVNVCRIAARQLEAGEPDDIHELVPLYLHRPEAEELWEKRHGGRDKTVG